MQDNTNPPKKPNFTLPTDDGRKKYTYLYTDGKKLIPQIPYNTYLIDSAKFYIPTHLFKEINIPNEFILMNKATGEVIDDFKKNSLTIPYKNHKIYLGREKKVLPNTKVIDNVVIYFPAKIDSLNYFKGITKELMYEVIRFLSGLGYLHYWDIHKLVALIECKDLDIKTDIKFEWTAKENIKLYQKTLKERFTGYANMCNIFDSKKLGLGLQVYKREISTITKPFCKFYSKSDEIQSYINEFADNIKEEVNSYLIYRYEFTIKNISWFNHFEVSNKFLDILELPQDKLREIGKYYLIKNFQRPIICLPQKQSKQTPTERIFTLLIYDMIRNNRSINYIENIFLQDNNKVQRSRNKKLFNRCYFYASVPNEETREMIEKYTIIAAFDKVFGIE